LTFFTPSQATLLTTVKLLLLWITLSAISSKTTLYTLDDISATFTFFIGDTIIAVNFVATIATTPIFAVVMEGLATVHTSVARTTLFAPAPLTC
jgi:hypothetical protein